MPLRLPSPLAATLASAAYLAPCECPGTITALERLIHQQYQNSG
ncbi:MAG: hypothetical protein ACJ8BW_04450 [Ktedonobacteraceae bacterium]